MLEVNSIFFDMCLSAWILLRNNSDDETLHCLNYFTSFKQQLFYHKKKTVFFCFKYFWFITLQIITYVRTWVNLYIYFVYGQIPIHIRVCHQYFRQALYLRWFYDQSAAAAAMLGPRQGITPFLPAILPLKSPCRHVARNCAATRRSTAS